MTCPRCQAAIPDESVFCLRCGHRLPPPVAVGRNGGGGRAPASPARPSPAPASPGPAPARPAPAVPPAAPGSKQAWTLAFKPLADERLRYRVARWVCEQAPVHALGEVQEALLGEGFATFLALTAAEAEAARQRIQALGAHPALWRLAPATTAELLLPERRSARAAKAEWSPRRRFAAVGIALLCLFLFGAVAAQRYFAVSNAPPPPTTGIPRLP